MKGGNINMIKISTEKCHNKAIKTYFGMAKKRAKPIHWQ